MRLVPLLLLATFIGCAHDRGPASLDGQPVAQASIALGNIKATAVKSIESQDVCFDITLVMKNVPKKEASPSNWTAAWVDQKSKYHLLNLNQRDPASSPQGGQMITPYGAYEEWSNTFRTCAPKARLGDVKSLVLTPKELSYKENHGLTLEWK